MASNDGEYELYQGVMNFIGNDDIDVKYRKGMFTVLEYDRDISVNPAEAQIQYFMSKMNIKRRQLAARVTPDSSLTLQAGAMQWTVGDVNATTGIKGAGDLFGKMIKGKVTGEGAIKPEYVGNGLIVCEPTYRHIILVDLAEWNGSVVVEDGMFLASQGGIKQTVVMRSNVSSAVAGGEGMFNLCMEGNGVVALESPVPYEELVDINLNNDILRIDGSYAVAWSKSLKFTVERSGKSLVGSAASGEGLVNVYRGTGRVLMRPL
ncbi:MAG: AIM24 family protein [Lachnospiraceae bacterium]|nr:AIM24 family protein [Lachnospiraceae bacterium]